jgi:hypothetical protein
MKEYFLSADQFIALSCDLADRLMQYDLKENYDLYIKKEGTSTSYTEAGQDIFNALVDEVEDILAGHNIFHEKEGEVSFKPDIKLLKGATPPEQNVIPFRIGAISGDADE